jgi:hypothetical protein
MTTLPGTFVKGRYIGRYSDDPEEDRMWDFVCYPTDWYIGPAEYDNPDDDCGGLL